MGRTAFLAEPIVSPGESMGGPPAAGVGLQSWHDIVYSKDAATLLGMYGTRVMQSSNEYYCMGGRACCEP